jgi:hypothetical protein
LLGENIFPAIGKRKILVGCRMRHQSHVQRLLNKDQKVERKTSRRHCPSRIAVLFAVKVNKALCTQTKFQEFFTLQLREAHSETVADVEGFLRFQQYTATSPTGS